MIFKFSVSKKIYQLNLDFVSSTINKKLFLLIIKNYEIVKNNFKFHSFTININFIFHLFTINIYKIFLILKFFLNF